MSRSQRCIHRIAAGSFAWSLARHSDRCTFRSASRFYVLPSGCGEARAEQLSHGVSQLMSSQRCGLCFLILRPLPYAFRQIPFSEVAFLIVLAVISWFIIRSHHAKVI